MPTAVVKEGTQRLEAWKCKLSYPLRSEYSVLFGAKIFKINADADLTEEFLKEFLPLECCRNEHRPNITHMLSWVRDLKDLETTGQGSVLQGWPTNPCCRSKHLKCSEVLLTILVIRIFTVLSLDWEQNKLDLFLHLALPFYRKNCSLSRPLSSYADQMGFKPEESASLSGALLQTFLTMGDFVVSALSHAPL